MLTQYEKNNPNLCPHAFNFGATLLCVEDFSEKK